MWIAQNVAKEQSKSKQSILTGLEKDICKKIPSIIDIS
jgi:hypothetical protein